jgi:hypothetical protein
MEEYKVKKKELKVDFLILSLALILVIVSLTNIIAFVVNEDTKFIKEKIIKIEKEIIELKNIKPQQQ